MSARSDTLARLMAQGLNERAGGRLTGSLVALNGVQVVGAQGRAIEAPTGGEAIDVQARRAIDEIIGALRAHGLIAC